MPISHEKLQGMKAAQLWQLYQNARRIALSGGANAADAKQTVELIEASGLPYYEGGGLSEDDPRYLRMMDIVFSAEGRQAALNAVKRGLPAICGVDALIKNALGADYGKHDLGTSNAGYIVAKLMRQMGYEEAGTGSCPSGCVARTGMKWRPKSKARKEKL
jgi:hypothetical protein